MITFRGFIVLFCGVLLLTSGFSFNSFYLTLLGVYLLVGLVVTLPLFATTANISGIQVTRSIDKVKVFSGDFLRVKVTITNTSRRHFDFIEVHDQYPEVWILAIGENFIASRIEPSSSITFSYILQVRMNFTRRKSYLLALGIRSVLVFVVFITSVINTTYAQEQSPSSTTQTILQQKQSAYSAGFQ